MLKWKEIERKCFLGQMLARNYLCLCIKKRKHLVIERKIKTKKVLWQKISEEMKLENYNISAMQIENKYKLLKRAYKDVMIPTQHIILKDNEKMSIPGTR